MSKVNDSRIEPQFISPRKVATLLGVSKSHIYTMIANGKMKTYDVGGRKIIPISYLQKEFEVIL